MIKRFSDHLTVSKILRIFGHAKFAKKKRCFFCRFRQLYRLSDGRFKCARCGRRFSLATNTYLANSRLSLDEWYELLWWFAYEFTAHKTARETGLPQRLVHRCFSVIRRAIYDYELQAMVRFLGEVEVDETYIGPKFKNRRKKKREWFRKLDAVKRGRGANKLQQPVFGLYQRDGQVYIEFVQHVDKGTLQDIIRGRVVLNSRVYSDTWKSYHGLKKQGYCHHTVDHGREQYVKPTREVKVHINGIEGFWGYLKERLLKHHGVARKNLVFYVKELEFRFNNRRLSTEELISKLVQLLISERLLTLEDILSRTQLPEKVRTRFRHQISLKD